MAPLGLCSRQRPSPGCHAPCLRSTRPRCQSPRLRQACTAVLDERRRAPSTWLTLQRTHAPTRTPAPRYRSAHTLDQSHGKRARLARSKVCHSRPRTSAPPAPAHRLHLSQACGKRGEAAGEQDAHDEQTQRAGEARPKCRRAAHQFRLRSGQTGAGQLPPRVFRVFLAFPARPPLTDPPSPTPPYRGVQTWGNQLYTPPCRSSVTLEQHVRKRQGR